MKNLTLVCVLTVFTMFIFSSCGGRKDYVCSCTVKPNPFLLTVIPPGFEEFIDLDTVIRFEIADAKKKDAENRCKGSDAAYKTIPIVIATCEL